VLYYLPGFAAPTAHAGLPEYQRIYPDLRMPLLGPIPAEIDSESLSLRMFERAHPDYNFNPAPAQESQSSQIGSSSHHAAASQPQKISKLFDDSFFRRLNFELHLLKLHILDLIFAFLIRVSTSYSRSSYQGIPLPSPFPFRL
jgi:hypothetical protein